jgi:hypothetical protein
MAKELQLEVAAWPADPDAIVLRKPFKELNSLVSQLVPIVPIAIFQRYLAISSPLFE